MATDIEIKEVTAKNSKLEAIEFLREMAGYPQVDYPIIAKRLNIPPSTARDYLKRYIWGVLHTMNDSDYPRRLMEIYNHDTVAVPPDKALTRKDINHLDPVVNKYARYTIEHPEVVRNKNSDTTESIRKVPGRATRTVTRTVKEEDEEEEDDDRFDEDDEEEDISRKNLMPPVAGSNNVQYIYNILKDIPGVTDPKIRRYLRFFTSNEADYMANPERFMKELKGWFGDGVGEMIFNSFRYGMTAYGKPGQGIGVNPYTGQSYSNIGSGATNEWIKNNPNLETYYKMNIIPYGVPPDSPIAIDAVNRFHERQRKKEEDEEEDRNFNRWLKARTAKAMEDNMGNGSGRGPDMMAMSALVGQGLVEMQVGMDETGKQMIRYVPRKRESNGGGLFGGGGEGGNGNMQLLQTIISGKDQLINTLIAKSMEQPKMMESLLGRFIQNMDPDPTAQFARMKQLAETLFPQNQNMQNSMEAMRLRLEEVRLNKDMTMADNESKRQWEKDKWEKERQERMEIEASKNTQNIMNGILGLGKEMLGPAIQLLTGKGLAGLFPGGMPGQGGMPNPFAGQQQQQNPFAGAGMRQPQQQQARTLSPETYAYMKNVEEAKRRAGPSPGFASRPGSFRPFQEAPRRPQVNQGVQRGDVIEEYDESPVQPQAQQHQQQPTVNDFNRASPEQLTAAEKELLSRKAEIDNYLNKVRVAKRRKTNVFGTRRPAPSTERYEEVVPTVGGGSTTINTTVPPQDIQVVAPKSEVGSVEIPDMVPEKAERDNVEVPGEVQENEEGEGEEDEEEEYEDDEEEGEVEGDVEEATEEK